MTMIMTGPTDVKQYDKLTVKVFRSKEELGLAAAQHAQALVNEIMETKASVNLLFSTGASQFTFVNALAECGLPWNQIHAFHLDEYLGMEEEHPASFRLWLKERIERRYHPASFSYIQGDAADGREECLRYTALLRENPIDVGFIGIGENGHIAFNDPPVADFHDPESVKIVTLDEACRKQQLGEGWFPTLDDVPRQAITLTVPAIMTCRSILSVVPDARKAQAVKAALTGPISTSCPASILRTHENATLYLDQDSAQYL